jgi:hypothetical protein
MLLNLLLGGVVSKLEDEGSLGNLEKTHNLKVNPKNYVSQGIDERSIGKFHSASPSEISNPNEYNLRFLDHTPLNKGHYSYYLNTIWKKAKETLISERNRKSVWNAIRNLFVQKSKPSKKEVFQRMMKMAWPRKILNKKNEPEDYFNTFEGHHTPEGFKKLLENLAKNGFKRQYPLGVYPGSDDKTYLVFDGSHRAAAGDLLQRKKLLPDSKITFLSIPYNHTKKMEYEKLLNKGEDAEKIFYQKYSPQTEL